MAKDLNWTRALPAPIDVGQRRKLKTLDDVRAHILALPETSQRLPVWKHAVAHLFEAAEGGDLADVTVALWFARTIDRSA